MQYIAMRNFTYKGKKIKKGSSFDVSGLNKYQLRGLKDWRRIKKDARTEGDLALDEGWNPDDALTITESDFAAVVTEDEKEVLVTSREELEAKYRHLGGRVNPDWSDEKLLEMIEKKS